ncbi:Disco-interacting protein 2 [Papilio xuthus]|uniref:Disco-interacting protein 2 n=1 Tax=Papilio xuthus TaxID=66420 RepID=A0A194Q4W6_PAPXU|nr:Disco-interacting protein 2 [Papilio xuthus]
MQNRPKPSLPMPSKRTSMMAKSPDRERHDLSSSSDEDSCAGDSELPPPPEMGSPPARRPAAPHPRALPHPLPQPHHLRDKKHAPKERTEIDLSEISAHLPAYVQPDVTHTTSGARRGGALVADRVQCYTQPEDTGTGTGRWKVSAKIQQLLNTLKRPKRRPLPEFYEDDDIELEIAANPKDPNAPKPEGGTMTPAVGEQLVVPAGLPRNLEAALQRYGTASFKANVATVLDPNGKLSNSLTYGKLLSRSFKIAHALLNKTFTSKSTSGGPMTGDNSIKLGDRVALVYPNNDPINFMCAFYGCLQAGVVPVPIEVPLTRRDAGLQQVGFLLGSCGIQYALTSDACLKGLPKTSSGDVVSFRGWPSLHWVSTEKLPRPPRDWIPPPRPAEDSPAHIEHTSAADGSAMGVIVTRASMLSHSRMLSVACNYTEGEHMVCVLDFKRETGLWHAVLASVLNGMHVIFIPYALMKVSPASWMHMITKYRASVAIVKSRDLHWGLLATRDHKEISLSSLRMLLVADGANPWSLSSCDQFLSVFQSKAICFMHACTKVVRGRCAARISARESRPQSELGHLQCLSRVRGDAICPCACSSESLTVCVRRAGRGGSSAGRGVLSMSGLSYGVVRVDAENSLTSLTLQDCGQVMPSCVIVVVKIEGPTYLCKTDEVGEICVLCGATGSGYWGLPGLTNTVFRVRPLDADGEPIGEEHYVRSGLLGFLGPGGLVFVCGSRDGLMTVTGRKHNMDDIIATVLAVEPMKFIYRGRIAVFSVRVLRDERICIIAEQRPDCGEEETFVDTADTVVDDTKTVVHTTDTVVDDTKTVVHTTDTVVDDTKTVVHTTDTVVDDTKTVVHTTDTVVDDTKTVVDTTDTVVDDTKTVVHTTDTVVDDTKTVVHTTDTVVDDTKTVVHTTDTVVDDTKTVVHTTDTVVDDTKTVVHTTDTVVDDTKTVVHTTDTVVDDTKTVVHTTDTVVDDTKTVVHTTDTVVDDTKTVVHTTDTVVDDTKTVVDTTDTVFDTTNTAVDTTDTVVDTTNTVVDTTDTVVDTTDTNEDKMTNTAINKINSADTGAKTTKDTAVNTNRVFCANCNCVVGLVEYVDMPSASTSKSDNTVSTSSTTKDVACNTDNTSDSNNKYTFNDNAVAASVSNTNEDEEVVAHSSTNPPNENDKQSPENVNDKARKLCPYHHEVYTPGCPKCRWRLCYHDSDSDDDDDDQRQQNINNDPSFEENNLPNRHMLNFRYAYLRYRRRLRYERMDERFRRYRAALRAAFENTSSESDEYGRYDEESSKTL